MKIKTTYISRPDWRRVISRLQIILPTEDKTGAVSLMRFDKITDPLIRNYDGGADIPIVFEGAYWLQLGYEGERYFFTAMFDGAGEFRQVYIDITAGNVCVPPDKAHFDDLFLDIVYTADGCIHILDRDELDEAESDGTLSPGLYSEVLALADKMTAELKEHGGDLVLKLKNAFAELKTKL